jgi:hypothetical protein
MPVSRHKGRGQPLNGCAILLDVRARRTFLQERDNYLVTVQGLSSNA